MTKQMSAQNVICKKATDSKHLKTVQLIQANNTKYVVLQGILFKNQSKIFVHSGFISQLFSLLVLRWTMSYLSDYLGPTVFTSVTD